MPIPLVNSVASWILKKRFHQIDLFLKYPYEVQMSYLQIFRVGKKQSLGNNTILRRKTYREFAKRVPVSTYENFHKFIERSRRGEQIIFGQTHQMVCKI